jgi:hypothetical protein
LMAWGLDLGLREGLGVGAGLQRSWLPRGAEDAQRAAAFAVGLAIPIVAWRALAGAASAAVMITVLLGACGAALSVLPPTRSRVTGLRFGLLLLGVAILYVGGAR